MNRAEHIQWCKDRAIEYIEMGEYDHGINSMVSDLSKHPETHNLPVLKETIRILLAHPPLTEAKIRKWIEGFN